MKTPTADTHLIHTIRLALRSHLRDQAVVDALATKKFDDEPRRRLVEVAAAADSNVPSALLLFHAEPGKIPADVIARAAEQIARYGTPEQLAKLTEVAPAWFADDADSQLQLLVSICDGLAQKGRAPQEDPRLREWLTEIAPPLLSRLAEDNTQWNNVPVRDLPESKNPWGVRHRDSADGHASAMFWDSISNGEELTGVLRSGPFKLPAKFSFWMCGHNGHPSTNNPPVNHIRLVLAETGEVLAKEVPPRHDIAQKFAWNFDKHVGEPVAIEIVDAHRESGYAWIGVGRFEPAVVRVPSAVEAPNSQRLVELVGQFELKDFAPALRTVAAQSGQIAGVRAAAIASADRLGEREKMIPLLAGILLANEETPEMRAKAAALLGGIDNPPARIALADALAKLPAGLQREAALAMSQQPASIGAMLDAIAAGKASARLLQDPQIAELIASQANEESKRRIVALTKDLPEASQQIAQLIASRQQSFSPEKANIERGRELFTKHCAACHRVGSDGGMVGPQLDGIGLRGAERILEDVFDPNRNVDITFRTTLIETSEGKLLTGLERRKEGQTLVLADAEGKEFVVPLAEIAGSRRTNLSLMPANLGETLKEAELHDLLAWLLVQKQTETKP
jgi:putative heme-binding domain-containing protein